MDREIYYGSDVITNAHSLAQMPVMNSYTFRDLFHLLNQYWRITYERICQLDPGFFSQTIKLTDELTHLPPFVMNTLSVYRARSPQGWNRQVYRAAGAKDLQAVGTYRISGNDLFCWDTKFCDIWCEFVPLPNKIFFTAGNRNPPILDPVITTLQPTVPRAQAPKKYWKYGRYRFRKMMNDVTEVDMFGDDTHLADVDFTYQLINLGDSSDVIDISDYIAYNHTGDENPWSLQNIYFDYPYAFASYYSYAEDRWRSVIYKDLLMAPEASPYNCFDYKGKDSNVRFFDAHYDDDTGMGVTILDYDDPLNPELTADDIGQDKYLADWGNYKLKELGFTPDSRLRFPQPCVFDWLVAKLAERLSLKNETQLLEIQEALDVAEHEMALFLPKNKSAWHRVDNITGPRIIDFL